MSSKGDIVIVNLSFEDTIEKVRRGVLREGASTKVVDEYGDGSSFHLIVFEKYYMRSSNRASLSVHISRSENNTKVYSIGAGGGQGALFSFDWGACDSFTKVTRSVLREHII